jgi:hypothetical protein
MVSLLERMRPPLPEVNTASVADSIRVHLEHYRAQMEDSDDFVGLNTIHRYLRGKQRHPSVPSGVGAEVRQLAKMSRVNVLDLIISSVAQSMYVEGHRMGSASDDSAAWAVWQANRMDARQSGIHRAALAYGAAYATVLPGEPVPVIRGYSPRHMVALYGDDDEWPVSALAIMPSGNRWDLRLFDDRYVYHASVNDIGNPAAIDVVERRDHGAPVVPVVRYLNTSDLDEDNQGEIERLIPIQDQIDDTTFSMLVAQRYAAFRQRWIIGWTAASEDEQLKAAASRLWTFEDETVKLGEFEQTDLAGYLASRESSLRHAATISQTPAHELIGQMINLSAEALVAAEASQRRKVTERQKSFGESHEQTLSLAAILSGAEVDTQAQVRWQDTESRALSATVDALGKMASMLGVPVQELWERVPGVSQQDVERWKATAATADPIANLEAMLARQAGDAA